jgi:hypothetical protein
MPRMIGSLHNTTPEFDYIKLLSMLSNYVSPRDQVTKLIKQRKIIRVKKGIYVLGPEFRRPFSTEILANMIYGPSYISGVSALFFYQLIPERTETTTSRTPNRKKIFETPVGRFTYEYLPMDQYRVSIDQINLDRERSFLIATREKALVEMIVKIIDIHSCADLLDWIQSMRIEPDQLSKFRLGELQNLKKVFPQVQLDFLIEIVRKKKK